MIDITENMKLIKDQEKEDLFYVAIRRDYNDEHELSIIATGKTVEEALCKALKNYKKCNDEAVEAINKIGNLISDTKTFISLEKFEPASCEVPKPRDFGHFIAAGYSSLGYNELDKKWYPFY